MKIITQKTKIFGKKSTHFFFKNQKKLSNENENEYENVRQNGVQIGVQSGVQNDTILQYYTKNIRSPRPLQMRYKPDYTKNTDLTN